LAVCFTLLAIGAKVINKTILITGACGGIGQALVQEYRSLNYQVIAIDEKEKINELGDVDFLKFNLMDFVSDPKTRNTFKAEFDNLRGENHLVAIINNAAVQTVKKFEDIDKDDWQETLEVNLLAPFFLTQLFLEELSDNYGSVLNISSIHASQTKKGFTVYATSKAALSALTKLLAIELGSRVRVNAIEPGAISTKMLEAGFLLEPEKRIALDNLQPMARIGEPSEVAKLASFLTSDSARFINGSAIAIDGGIRNQLHDPL
jgi:NAD(P)-dependent dehydrogenase (short-subunit alcohol dehydrogenase family)